MATVIRGSDNFDSGNNATQTEINSMLDTQNFMHVQDQKPSGTAITAITVPSGIRDLNTIVTNNIAGSSLSLNKVTLPAGTYYADGRCTMRGGNHRLTIYDEDNTVILGAQGINNYTHPSYGAQIEGTVQTTFTLSVETEISLRHYVGATSGAIAFGNGNVEVYADLKIWKVG